MNRIALKCSGWHGFVVLLAICISAPGSLRAEDARKPLPDHVPPKRSSQIQDGFGINSDLPRGPYLPWNRWWWTRMFDAGFKWIRIGQYENSSDRTSWDWIEQQRGVYSSSPELEDAVDSLVDNGVNIQLQLLYGNPMYTAAAGKLPDKITPEPGSFHNADRSLYSVFWPPKTPEQIAAFNRYVKWMVDNFRDRIHYWALWNEEDINYWNPAPSPEDYGTLLKSFVHVVRQSDDSAKVIYGGQADPSRDFTKRALDRCECASGIDVYAYHTYPGYGQNLNPEAMDYGAYLTESPRLLRELVRNYPGVRSDIQFFDDEFNSIPSWKGSDESVQAKYVPRGLVYNLAAGVKTFVWHERFDPCRQVVHQAAWNVFGLNRFVRSFPRWNRVEFIVEELNIRPYSGVITDQFPQEPGRFCQVSSVVHSLWIQILTVTGVGVIRININSRGTLAAIKRTLGEIP